MIQSAEVASICPSCRLADWEHTPGCWRRPRRGMLTHYSLPDGYGDPDNPRYERRKEKK